MPRFSGKSVDIPFSQNITSLLTSWHQFSAERCVLAPELKANEISQKEKMTPIPEENECSTSLESANLKKFTGFRGSAGDILLML